jgi:hypothetical protein
MTLSATSTLSAAQVEANTGQPFTGPPILSIGRAGELVLNFATGDQTLFTTKTFAAGSNNTINDELPEWNFVWSVSDISGVPTPNWYVPFAPHGAITPQYNHAPTYNTACNAGDSTCTGGSSTYSSLAANNTGERVTGPMTVFDGVLYFATLKPADDVGEACALAETRIYGMDYQKLNISDDTQFTNGTTCTHMNEVGIADIGCGGAYRLPVSAAGPATQHPQYDRPADANSALEGTLIPGVAITQNQSCFSTSSGADNYFGNPSSSYQTLTQPQTPVLTYLATTNSTGKITGSTATTSPIKMKINPPTRATRIDSWAAVID